MFICEICGKAAHLAFILPKKRENGRSSQMVCRSCAVKSDSYCLIHHAGHTAYADDTHACIYCIVDAVEEKGIGVGHAFIDRIEKVHERWQPLFDWDEQSMQITGEFYYKIIGRAIIVLAYRLNKSYEWVIHETCRRGPEFLLDFEK